MLSHYTLNKLNLLGLYTVGIADLRNIRLSPGQLSQRICGNLKVTVESLIMSMGSGPYRPLDVHDTTCWSGCVIGLSVCVKCTPIGVKF